jgi:F-type H+-transporting ATPase subunit b
MKSFRIFLAASVSAAWTVNAHAAGIPQMDQTWYANQLLWLAISFALLYAIVSLFIAPTAASILATREGAINDAIAEAEKAKRAAETTKSDFESGGQSARAQASELIAKAQAENNKAAADAIAKLDHELARKLEQAETRIVDARTKAHSSMQDATASLAGVMAAKLLGRAVTAEEATAATSPIVNLKKAS